ncbi:cupin domain-containing protein [Cohaesibacter haloalkalitolerans]|uniref:cupin domain-containing protein n=1 Tax=Cohaesibacter haloalkalitolerans TaxID=1162980 RepID=UPI000E64FC97|nr:cupin domain-containing protein [Cohaesibacter haloalkalitolerans]
MDDADAIVKKLGMQPHPEGGYFIQTFRDEEGPEGRGHSTVIYYLLKTEQRSHWHRVDAVEVWFWQAGAPLELSFSKDGTGTETLILGPDILADQQPQGIVPRHVWQSARSLGAWSLVSCMVAPGFLFEGFEMAEPDWTPAP